VWRAEASSAEAGLPWNSKNSRNTSVEIRLKAEDVALASAVSARV